MDLNKFLILRKDKKIFRRKFMIEFLTECLKSFDVGIYTSMILKDQLRTMIPPKFIDKFIFVWDRSKCIKDPEGVNKWDTLKSLELVKAEYSYSNILFLDDSLNKLRHIPADNKIIVAPFEDLSEEGEVLKDLLLILKEKIFLNENGEYK
jgi:hypothetical protein